MGIAQPALSQRIKALEGRLGVELFDRTKRAVRLSPAGKAFAGEAERLVNEGERAMRIARPPTRVRRASYISAIVDRSSSSHGFAISSRVFAMPFRTSRC
ncbi:LysR family transcriptional regulator [Klebsiella pneumoniae]|nr:LysR family transcriptional regulator [Klebsiella pneumoniae]